MGVLGVLPSSTVGEVVQPATHFLRQQFPVSKNPGLYAERGLFYTGKPKTSKFFEKKYDRPVDVYSFDDLTAQHLPTFNGVRDISVGFITAGDEHYWPFVAPDESQAVLVALHYDDDLEAIIGTNSSLRPTRVGYQANHWLVHRPAISPFVLSISQGDTPEPHPLEPVAVLQEDVLRYLNQAALGLGITSPSLHCRIESHPGEDAEGTFTLVRWFPSYAVAYDVAQGDPAHSHSLKFSLAEKGLFTRIEDRFNQWPVEEI